MKTLYEVSTGMYLQVRTQINQLHPSLHHKLLQANHLNMILDGEYSHVTIHKDVVNNKIVT